MNFMLILKATIQHNLEITQYLEHHVGTIEYLVWQSVLQKNFELSLWLALAEVTTGRYNGDKLSISF